MSDHGSQVGQRDLDEADLTLPFIDCHHHIWDPSINPHPWLRKEPQIPFRYGDYSSIRGPYLPADYDRDAGQHSVTAHVTMEGEWDESDPVGETRWLAGVFAEAPGYAGHVARASLHRPDVESVLEGHAGHPFVKGIRHKPAAAASPDNVEPGTPAGMSDPNWQRGYALLASHGFHFELQAPWWHVGELLALIDRFPETPVVINHAFLPANRSPEGLVGWTSALRQAASAPNATLKISGMGVPGRPWSLEDNGPIINTCIETFGPDRCLIASNFPVDRLTGSFDAIIGGYRRATASLSRADRLKLFHDNAIRVYRLGIPLLAS